ncbi:MAG: hypothetical protein BGO41_01535 [Clostridiales bacterium 38-18]|nr:MAG: hypothetical protein BGO41_01535 [Clostridiales bacterium 38-18]
MISNYNEYKNFIIKDVSHNDQIKIQELCNSCVDYFLISQGKPATGNEAQEFLMVLPPNKTFEDKINLGIFNIAEDLVGFVDLIRNYPQNGTWYIGLLLIDSKARRNGLGKYIIHEIIKMVKKDSGEKIKIGVLIENESALKFWESMGFVTTEKSEIIFEGVNRSIYKMEYQIL